MSTIIFADDDLDGTASVKILKDALGIPLENVIFQVWDKFGLTDEDVETILARKPKTVFIMDIGSGIDVLEQVEKMLDLKIEVHIFDNHPPELEVVGKEAMEKFIQKRLELEDTGHFTYHSTRKSCTTGLVFDFVGRPASASKWAILGLVGDVASTTEEGAVSYLSALQNNPIFQGLIVSKDTGGKYNWGLVDFFAQIFHVPRRILLNDAPKLAVQAMDEMDKLEDWFTIFDASQQLFSEDVTLDPTNPIAVDKRSYLGLLETYADTYSNRFGLGKATAKVLWLHCLWRQKWKDVEKRENHITLDFPKIGITVIRSEWNIGSAFANVLSNEGKVKKTQFVINKMPSGQIQISARSPTDSKVHIGKVFANCNPEIIKGGGLKEAGSGQGQIKNVEKIIGELAKITSQA